MRKTRGFTLVEILMVLFLVGLLSAIAIPTFVTFGDGARETVTKQKLQDIKRAIVGDPRAVVQGQYVNPGYENHMGAAPTSITVLTTQGAQANYNPFTKKGWRGPYLSTTATDWDKDAWGSTIIVDGVARTITSWGPDKASGGGDDIVVTF